VNEQLEHIIKGCKKFNAISQKQLYLHCYDVMFKVCLRYLTNEHDAANGYNEAMNTVLTKIEQYKHEGEFMGWVRRIIVNTCLNIIKREKKYSFKEIGETVEDGLKIEPEVYEYSNPEYLYVMINELPDQTRMVFNLYILEGYTHEQVGVILGISGNTSKWHLNNARTILKTKIINYQKNENHNYA
jgi:RNA polymerase sigma-70 factor, ECF subfamily